MTEIQIATTTGRQVGLNADGLSSYGAGFAAPLCFRAKLDTMLRARSTTR